MSRNTIRVTIDDEELLAILRGFQKNVRRWIVAIAVRQYLDNLNTTELKKLFTASRGNGPDRALEKPSSRRKPNKKSKGGHSNPPVREKQASLGNVLGEFTSD